MSLGLDRQSLENAANLYGSQLYVFSQQYNLPVDWFAVPDHLAIKCADAADYDLVVNAARTYAEEIHEVPMNNRRLGSARLRLPLTITGFGEVSWLEVMEPRPEKVGSDVVGIDHAEFFFPNFDEVADGLTRNRVPYERQSNPSHEWISIQIGAEQPLELKLNNGTLADVVKHELEDGQAYVVWQG